MIPRRRPDAPLQRISRRGLITSGVLAGVLAATGVPVHAQRRGGVLRLALPGQFAGWGIGQQDLFARVAGSGTVFDTLTEVAASGELVGELAESWTARESGAVWSFTLRRGTVFHDGAPVTAADVVASLERHRDLASPVAWLLNRVVDMSSQASDRVSLQLAYPNADLPLLLADPHLMIAPGGRVEEGIGSGLYRVAGGADGSLELTRVAAHYKDGKAGWFDRVTLLPSDDAGQRAVPLADGLTDAATNTVAPAGWVTAQTAASQSLLLVPPAPPVTRELAQARTATDLANAISALEARMDRSPTSFTLVHAPRLRHSEPLGNLAALDSGRIAERWWWG